MEILVSIDDTDNLTSRGTGKLAAILANDLDKNGWGKCAYISRHQLFVHPDVPYTSHNSAMCFSADIAETHMETFISYAAKFLETESAEGSDPGLCIVAPGQRERIEELVTFGQKAKRMVLTQREAYELAGKLNIRLSAHGGTGDGVIGALAGAGLRMSGNDGRMRGSLNIGEVDSIVGVGDIRGHHAVDEVRSLDGRVVPDGEMVILGEKVKTVLLAGKAVLLVTTAQGDAQHASWQTCPKQLSKAY